MNEVNYSSQSPIIPPAQPPQPAGSPPAQQIPPQTPESPKPPKKKGIFAYVGFALIGGLLYYLSAFAIPSIVAALGAYGFLLIIALMTFILSSIFFKKETLIERIGKSILATVFLVLITLVVGLGFCFLLLAGGGAGV